MSCDKCKELIPYIERLEEIARVTKLHLKTPCIAPWALKELLETIKLPSE